MLNRIPLGGPWRHMRHRNLHPKFISQLLQAKFPEPGTTTVWVAAIDLDQQLSLPGISEAPDLDPPPPDGGDGEIWRLARSADDDKAVIRSQIVNPIRDSHAIGVTWVVIFQDRNRLSAPRAARILEI